MIFIRRKEFNQLLARVENLEKLIYPKGLTSFIPYSRIKDSYPGVVTSGNASEEQTSIMDSIRNIKETIERKKL